jgi:hypothetical protein
MAGFKEMIESVSGWLGSIIEFGLGIIMVFVIIDILFPGTTGIIGNIGSVVGAFADQGVAGLIALFLFMLIYKK